MNLSHSSLFAVFFLAACSSNDTTNSPSPDGSTPDVDSSTSPIKDASGTDTSVAKKDGSTPNEAGIADAGTDAATAVDSGMVTLSINDQDNWCSISVNGGTAAVIPSPLAVAPGTVVTLHADTNNASLFKWGFWIGTAGDTSASHDTSMSTTVTVNQDTLVQVCCPLLAASTCP